MPYQKGETYKNVTEVKDSITLNYVDPDTITCTILKPDGSQADSGAMTKDAVGKYSYKYNIPSDTDTGVWKAKITDVTGTDTTIGEIAFVVE